MFAILDYGDSGSWVIRDHKVCGYIVAIAVGELLAYMVPIEPVLQEIGRVVSISEHESIGIPSEATLAQLTLQAAAQGGDEATVKLLLDQLFGINAQGGNYDNALKAAAGN